MMKPTVASSSPWSRAEDKRFERAIVIFPEETPYRWEKIAEEVPGKAAWEVREHYQALLHDVSEIDSGRVELPNYADCSFNPDSAEASTRSGSGQISFGPKSKAADTERKKGVPWTEEEHRLFLIGLQKYGKGDWRSISRNAVVSRTPTQVASHAQKYYLRMNSVRKEKKRSSIHDITTVQTSHVAPPDEQRWTDPPPINQHGPQEKMAPSQFPSLPQGEPYLGQFTDPRASGYRQFGYSM